MRVAIITALLIRASACASGGGSFGDADDLGVNDIRVLSVVLAEMQGSRPIATVVVTETAAFLPAGWKGNADVAAPVSPTQTITISRELIDRYSARNTKSYAIPPAAVPGGVAAITPDRIAEVTRSDGDMSRRRVIRVSAPGYARSGTVALVSFSVTEGPLAGSVGFMILRKNGESWAIETVVPYAAA